MSFSILESNWLRLQRQISRMTKRDDAEDLLHNSFVRMSGNTDRSVAKPEAFLSRSAINAARDDFRRAAHPATPQPMDPQSFQVSDQMPLQDETLIARQRLERVKEGLTLLSPRSREIFLMRRLDGLKCREIAETLNISMSAVEKHVTKSVQFLAAWTDGW